MQNIYQLIVFGFVPYIHKSWSIFLMLSKKKLSKDVTKNQTTKRSTSCKCTTKISCKLYLTSSAIQFWTLNLLQITTNKLQIQFNANFTEFKDAHQSSFDSNPAFPISE